MPDVPMSTPNYEQFALEIKHKEFALEKFAESRGWKIEKFYREEHSIGMWYAPIDAPYDRGCHQPTIDHPFMHELIKGLDSVELKRFEFALHKIVRIKDLIFYTPKGSGNVIHANIFSVADIITATVLQLLQAYWRVFNDQG